MKSFFKKKSVIAVIVIVVIGGGYYAYGKIKGSATVAPQYVTAKATKGALVVSVTGSGQMTDSNQTNITAQGSGNVVNINVINNQKVAKGQLLFGLDTTNDDRSVRNAQLSLQSAQFQLQSLESPPTTSTLLQSQNGVAQAKQASVAAVNSLATDYNTAYTDISNTFIDLPTAVNGLNTILYGQTINKSQGDIDAYTNMIETYAPTVVGYNSSAASSYQSAIAAYNQNLTDYKNTNIYSSTSTVASLLSETYATLKQVSVANNAAKNLLDLVQTTLQQNEQKLPAQLSIDETNIQSYITATNGHLATILNIQNTLATDAQQITSAQLSLAQSQASLDQLQAGPTQLQIEQQQLSLTQAQNSLADAQANLANDYVRSPFDGIITNIAAKLGQPPPSTLAVLVSNIQLAQATFNETDVVNIKVGQPATITFDAIPNTSLTGKVSQVDTIGTVTQGVVSYNVQVALDEPNDQVKPGMSDSMAIVTKVDQDVILVPNSAVSTKQGVSSVQVMGASGTPTPTQVTIGPANTMDTEILSGVNDGDTIVTQTKSGSTATTAARPAAGIGGGGGGVRFGGGGGLGGF